MHLVFFLLLLFLITVFISEFNGSYVSCLHRSCVCMCVYMMPLTKLLTFLAKQPRMPPSPLEIDVRCNQHKYSQTSCDKTRITLVQQQSLCMLGSRYEKGIPSFFLKTKRTSICVPTPKKKTVKTYVPSHFSFL
jgi:hypothetical protein